MPRRKPKNKNLSKEQELQLKDKLDGILLADEMLAGLSAPDIPPIKPQRLLNVDGVKYSTLYCVFKFVTYKENFS